MHVVELAEYSNASVVSYIHRMHLGFIDNVLTEPQQYSSVV